MSINLLNTYRNFEVNSSIVEWDMKRAGLNLIRENKLLPQNIIDELISLPKHECDIKIGKLQIRDKEFSKRLEQAFTDYMEMFLSANHVDRDLDVIAIKKDACFTINKTIETSTFGEHISFVPKNSYHAFIYIKPFEFYFQKDGEIDIKGLVGDKKVRNELISLHKEGILNLLSYVVELAETTGMDKEKLNEFLHSFVSMYKNKELDFSYYREFTVESKFRYQFLGAETMADMINEKMLAKVNIEYNYKKIILPLVNILC